MAGAARLRVFIFRAFPWVVLYGLSASSARGSEWGKLKLALTESAISILALNEKAEIFFLDRDARLVFVAATEIAKKMQRPDILKRLHLLPFSRDSVNDPLSQEFLRQEGISEAEFQSGKKLFFVDTGFQGRVIDVFKSRFEKYVPQINGTLLSSITEDYPESRVFGVTFGPNSTVEANKNVRLLSRMSKATGSIVGYKKSQTKIVPVFDGAGDDDDGAIDPDKAKQLREELTHFVAGELPVEFVSNRWDLWAKARKLYDEGNVEALTTFLQQNKRSQGDWGKAFVSDFVELTNTVLVNPRVSLKFSSFGISSPDTRLSSLRRFVLRGDKFGRMAINPRKMTKSLIQTKHFKTLESVLEICLADDVIRSIFENALDMFTVPVHPFDVSSLNKDISQPLELLYVLKGILQELVTVEGSSESAPLKNLIERILTSTNTKNLSETLSHISTTLNPFECDVSLRRL